MDGIIENEQKYLRERGDPNYMLKMGHAQTENKQEKLRKGFEDTKEFVAEVEQWKKEKQIHVNAGVPLLEINKLHRAHLENIEKLKIKFDKGELTPIKE